MQIAPFSFREFGESDAGVISRSPKAFLPNGRKKEEAPPPPPPPPVFSEDDVKAAERDAYQKGYLEGMEEGKRMAHSEQADINATLTQTIQSFVKHLAPLFANYRNSVRDLSKQMPEIAHAIAKKVAGAALHDNAGAAINDIVGRCVEAMIHEPKLSVTVHESLKDSMEEHLRALTEKLRVSSDIVVVGDATIAPPNCRIEWKNGAMQRDTEQLWQQVEQVIETMIASAQRDSDVACDAIEPTITTPPEKGD